jgi:predicted permease
MTGTILSTAVNAVFPIVLLIFLGYFLRRTGFLTENFVKVGNKLVFRLCLPATLFVNVYEMDSVASVPWNVVLYCTGAIVALFLLGMAVSVATTKDNRRRGVIWQCSFRSNFAIIGLALAASLGGSEAEGIAAVVSAFTIPVFNVLAVVALTMFVKDEGRESKGVKGILVNIAKNPLIIGVIIGLICLGIRSWQVSVFQETVFSLKEDLKFLYTTINNLKSIASPFAMVVLGGQFQFSAVKELKKEIIVGTVWRIVIAPFIGIGGAVLLSRYTNWISCGVNEYPALIALFGSPVAVSSAIMAKGMGNDEQLATQLVVWTTLFSGITVFLSVCILMSAGLII